METLKTMGEIAGIAGLALGTFLILFRDVVRKNIFSNLTEDQSYKLMRLIIILVWSVTIVGIAAWLIAPMITHTQQAGEKIVIVIDSPPHACNEDLKKSRKTNTSEIMSALKDIRKIKVSAVKMETAALDSDDGQKQIRQMNPDLVIVQLTGQATHPEAKHAEKEKIILFFQNLAKSKTKFLVYTCTPDYKAKGFMPAWMERVAPKDSPLAGKIKVSDFPEKFNDPEVQRKFKEQVREMLHLPAGPRPTESPKSSVTPQPTETPRTKLGLQTKASPQPVAPHPPTIGVPPESSPVLVLPQPQTPKIETPTPTPPVNVVTQFEEIINKTFTLEAGKYDGRTAFFINKNMRNVRLEGWLEMSGGGKDDVYFAIMKPEDLEEFIHSSGNRGGEMIYISRKIIVSLTPGNYYLVFSNRHASSYSKTVRAKLVLYWQ